MSTGRRVEVVFASWRRDVATAVGAPSLTSGNPVTVSTTGR